MDKRDEVHGFLNACLLFSSLHLSSLENRGIGGWERRDATSTASVGEGRSPPWVTGAIRDSSGFTLVGKRRDNGALLTDSEVQSVTEAAPSQGCSKGLSTQRTHYVGGGRQIPISAIRCSAHQWGSISLTPPLPVP